MLQGEPYLPPIHLVLADAEEASVKTLFGWQTNQG